MIKNIIAIDPGSTQSGVCVVELPSLRPLYAAKLDNEDVTPFIQMWLEERNIHAVDTVLAIEDITIYQMSNKDIRNTLRWADRYEDRYANTLITCNGQDRVIWITRGSEYRTLCADIYPHNDKGIRAALVERFAPDSDNAGKGTKINRGWFYGFKADIWSAYAVAVTCFDKNKRRLTGED